MAEQIDETVGKLMDQYKADILKEVEALFAQLLEDIQDDHQRRLDDITAQFESFQDYIASVMAQSTEILREQLAPKRPGRTLKEGASKTTKKRVKKDDISLDDLPY